ncbi:phage tail tape measure protein [Salmonella enterica subsp. enterica]|uniref:Phage tail tape measure protein n=1 Tax=Salmonella enterica I TaxID=59201 RepID=A0A3S4IX73_SALET|nr:phage tail tape measure protein [Salmonella enterica subsp. enterica]
MNLLQLNPAEIEKQMTTDAMGTIQRVLEKVNNLPPDKRLSAMTMIFGKELAMMRQSWLTTCRSCSAS